MENIRNHVDVQLMKTFYGSLTLIFSFKLAGFTAISHPRVESLIVE